MARKIVFTNGIGETLTLANYSPLLLTSVEGLGTPETSVQQQKAPYQDGTTYIDALLDNREIVVECSIIAPNDFTNIDTYRRELVKKLSPKNGIGSITYTTEAGNQYKIAVLPSGSPTFGNKDYREPFLKAQITFIANDPYWQKITSDTINLPTSVTSAESVINGALSYVPSVIQLANGNLFIVYRRSSDNYLVSRTYTTSWSAESVINAAYSNAPSVIQRANGDLFVAYIRISDGYLVSRTYTTSWSAESVINANINSSNPCVIEKANGNLFIVYGNVSTGYIYSREYTTSWGSQLTINAAISRASSVIQLSNGNLFVAYGRQSDDYLVSRTYTDSWSAESTISPSAIQPSIIERADGTLAVVYTRNSDSYLAIRTYSASLWSSEGIISPGPCLYPEVIELSDKTLYIAYLRTSDNYLVSITRSVTPTIATITGDYSTPLKVTFNGPSVNPRIINADTLEYIRLNTTLATGDNFVVNTQFGNKTVVLTQGGIVKNGIAYLDIGSTFFQLALGANTVYFEDDAVLSTATATMEWTERYIGV